jgi:hypothetical protein
LNAFGGYKTLSWNGSSWNQSPGGSVGTANTNTGEIPMGGAFWLRNIEAGLPGVSVIKTFTLNESDKVSGSISLSGRTNNTSQLLYVNLFSADGKTGYDGGTIYYNATSNADIDSEEDIEKINIGDDNLSLVRKNSILAIEARPNIIGSDTIFIRLHNLRQSTYRLSIEPDNFVIPLNYMAVLRDVLTNTEKVLAFNSGNEVYNFNVTSNTVSNGDRFMIVFRNNQITPISSFHALKNISLNPNPVKRGAIMKLSLPNGQAGKYELVIYDMLGLQVLREVFIYGGGSTIQNLLIPGRMCAGTYLAEISGASGYKTQQKMIVE